VELPGRGSRQEKARASAQQGSASVQGQKKNPGSASRQQAVL